MDSSKKRMAKNSIALFIRMGIIVVVSLYASRVMLQQLGVSDFGIYNVVGGLMAMLAFMNASLSQGVQRFLNFYIGKKDDQMANKIFSSSCVIQLAFVVILLIIGESLGYWFIYDFLNIPSDRVSAAFWVYQFSLFSLVIGVLQVPYMALILSHEDMYIYTYISIVEAFFKLGVVYLLSISPIDKLITYGLLFLVTTILINLLYVIFSSRRYTESHFLLNRDVSVYKSLLTFSGWNIMGTSSNLMTVQGVNIVLNLFFGTAINAARGIAVQVSTQLDNMINNVQVAMNPQIVKHYSMGEIAGMTHLLINNFKWNFFLFWLLALPLFIKIDYVLSLWLGVYPDYTTIFVSIGIVRCLLKCIERPLISSLFAVGKMKYPNIMSSSFMLVSLALAYVLFKMGYPPYCAFLLDLFAILANIIYSVFFLRKYKILFFRLFLRKVAYPILLIMIPSAMMAYCFNHVFQNNFVGFVLFGFSTLIVSGICVYMIGLSASNRKLVKDKIGLLIKR
ncbi:hypothetical protein [Bacteroides cellulosilyticus]|uniref:hypothetical protein n=1 Tax=Bacteroides cellulosilyticus TaxID=246787 RepID=UPI0032C11BB9